MLPGMWLATLRSSLVVVRLEFREVLFEFRFAGKAAEEMTKHFERSLGRLSAGPNIDQQASDHCAVALNGDAVGAVADQVRAAQKLFEETEEYFNYPALQVDQRNDFGGHIEQVGNNPQDSIAAGGGAGETSTIAASTTGMW